MTPTGTVTLGQFDEFLGLIDYPRRKSLPLAVGILSDLSGMPAEPLPPIADRQFIDLTPERFDWALGVISPRLALRVRNVLGGGGWLEVELLFRCLADFDPLAIAAQVKPLRERLDEWSRKSEVQDHTAVGATSVARLEALINVQISAILHHRDFRKLEASWRGLHSLAGSLAGRSDVCIRVLDASQKDLAKTTRKYKGAAWDQSPLYKLICEKELGTFGGQPFGLLLFDYPFCHEAADSEVLAGLAQIAAASHAQILAEASPRLFGESRLAPVAAIRNLRSLFKTPEYAKWASLRATVDAGNLSLGLPRVLLRYPYRHVVTSEHKFPFDERTPHRWQLLWGNPIYAIGAAVIGNFGHVAPVRVASGTPLSDLPTVPVPGSNSRGKSALEVEFDSRSLGDLADLGLLPLGRFGSGERSAFYTSNSLRSAEESTQTKTGGLADRLFRGRVQHKLNALRFQYRGATRPLQVNRREYDAWRSRLSTQRDPSDDRIEIAHNHGVFRLVRDPVPQTLRLEFWKPASWRGTEDELVFTIKLAMR